MTVNEIRLYISASSELDRERDLLGRAVSEIPVPLGWRIHQTPRKNDVLDLEAVSAADIHFLLFGSDIRAPVGLEWYRARGIGRTPLMFLRTGIQRTPAAQEFIHFTGQHSSWFPYRHRYELRFEFLSRLTKFIDDRAAYFGLSPVEIESLRLWRAELSRKPAGISDEAIGGAGESGKIYSTKRYEPSEGILLDPDNNDGSSPLEQKG